MTAEEVLKHVQERLLKTYGSGWNTHPDAIIIEKNCRLTLARSPTPHDVLRDYENWIEKKFAATKGDGW